MNVFSLKMWEAALKHSWSTFSGDDGKRAAGAAGIQHLEQIILSKSHGAHHSLETLVKLAKLNLGAPDELIDDIEENILAALAMRADAIPIDIAMDMADALDCDPDPPEYIGNKQRNALQQFRDYIDGKKRYALRAALSDGLEGLLAGLPDFTYCVRIYPAKHRPNGKWGCQLDILSRENIFGDQVIHHADTPHEAIKKAMEG